MAPQNHNRLANAVAGAGLLVTVAAGAGAVASGELSLGTDVAVSGGSVRPSNELADVLNDVEAVGEIIGAAALANRGIVLLQRSRKSGSNPAREAIDTMAHAQEQARSTNAGRLLASYSLLAMVGAAATGNFVDIGHSVGSSQSNVAESFGKILGQSATHPGQAFMISNSPTPELADSSTLSPKRVQSLIISANKEGVTADPVRWEWHDAVIQGDPTVEKVIASGFPESVTRLPEADGNCDDVQVEAAKELGKSFTIDGLEVHVRQVIDGDSGAGLLPVIFNNSDFVRCVDTYHDQAYSAVLMEGQKAAVTKVLAEQGISPANLAERVYMVPLSQFNSYSKQAGENDVNPYVFQALAELLLLGGVALAGQTKNQIVENRRANTFMEANGSSKRLIAKIQAEIADAKAVKSSLAAAPLIFLADYATNTSIPGGDVGPSVKTVLFVVGASWGVGRLSNAYAMRREAPNINLAKGNL